MLPTDTIVKGAGRGSTRHRRPLAGISPERVTRILHALSRPARSRSMELNYRSPYELLVATILSAQCTDRRVNQVTPGLFHRYRRPSDLANANLPELERMIRTTGFFKAKARNLVACGRALQERFGGTVPRTMDELVSLPGVGRKTANVILGNAFQHPAVVVDTHVKRVSQRLGWARSGDPNRIEIELQQLLPRRQWTAGSQRLLLHGRYVCTSRSPKCRECVIASDCPWEGKRLQ